MQKTVTRFACTTALLIACLAASTATAWAAPRGGASSGAPIPPGTVIHAASCEQPPAQSAKDRTTYTAAEIQRYGLPPREPGESFDHWAQIVRSIGTKRYCDRQVTNLRTHLQATSDQHFTNWAGNIADEPNIFNPETYSEIDMDFYVPCVTAGQDDAHASFWVGLGGWNNNNLVQTGVDAHRFYVANYGWASNYHAWVENYGDTQNPGENEVFPVSCNDHMWVRAGGSEGSNCNYVADWTTGQYSDQCYGPGANQTSAEGIAERPSLNGTVTILANFGTVTFRGVGITDNGSYKAMSAVNHDYSNMWSNDNSYTLATVGPIVNDPNDNPYDDYDVTWQRYS